MGGIAALFFFPSFLEATYHFSTANAAYAASAGAILDHPLADEYYQQRSADLSKITVPLLAAGNWAHHVHTRGTFEGYTRVSSGQKWLEVHGLQH